MEQLRIDGGGLPESCLHTLIDEPREFAVYFLEGQKLIHDLALVHSVRGDGFAWFRDVLLSIQPLIALLKHGEQIGFYLDSSEPPFQLKIETSHQGATRCALLPESFAEFPDAVRGVVRLIKLFPRNRPPYESVLQLQGLPLREIVNRVLRESYQVHSEVVVSHTSDQSLMLHQLPPIRGEYEYSHEMVRKRRKKIQDDLEAIFSQALHGSRDPQAAFAEIGFRRLASRTVRFRCSCNRERFIHGIRLATGRGYEHLFEAGRETLEAVCEYCKTAYEISRRDLASAVSPLH